MLGVSKELRYDPREKVTWQVKLVEFTLLLRQILKISFEFIRLNSNVKKFLREFDEEFKRLNSIDLTNFSDQELLNFYLMNEQKFFRKWRITIVNDLATMIATGIARKIAKVWFNDKDNILLNQHLANVKHLESTRPGERFKKILLLIKNNKEFSKLFQHYSNAEILRLLLKDRKFSKLKIAIDDYLKAFGDRSPNELKLESKTYTDSTKLLLTLIKNQLSAVTDENGSWVKTADFDEKFLKKKRTKKFGFIKELLFKLAIKQSHGYIRNREAARLKRSQIFGFARKVFKEFGRRLAQHGFVNDKLDIFFLQVEEIIGIFNGTLVQKDFKSQIETRKKEFSLWSKIDLPERIEITDSIYKYELKKLEELKKIKPDQCSVHGKLKGLTCSTGINGDVVFGEALVMKTFNPKASFVGKILVARQTDPGWTPIFPYLKGVIVERGGMLSHAAIVAREFGIPCISSVPQATNIITTGQKITLNVQEATVYFKN